VEHRALAQLEQKHPHEPFAVLERQYLADRILAARRARARKEEEAKRAHALRQEKLSKLHIKLAPQGQKKAQKTGHTKMPARVAGKSSHKKAGMAARAAAALNAAQHRAALARAAAIRTEKHEDKELAHIEHERELVHIEHERAALKV
jgi:hypothetical protein